MTFGASGHWLGIQTGAGAPRIRKDFKEIGINMRSSVDLAQNRDYWKVFVNAALSVWVP